MLHRLNRVQLVGRVGSPGEIKKVGKSDVANFTVATNRSWTKDGKPQDETEWHAVTARGYLAKISSGMDKGQAVFIEGRLQTNKWEDNGIKKSRTIIIAERIAPISKTRHEEPAEEPDLSGWEPVEAPSKSV